MAMYVQVTKDKQFPIVVDINGDIRLFTAKAAWELSEILREAFRNNPELAAGVTVR